MQPISIKNLLVNLDSVKVESINPGNDAYSKLKFSSASLKEILDYLCSGLNPGTEALISEKSALDVVLTCLIEERDALGKILNYNSIKRGLSATSLLSFSNDDYLPPRMKMKVYGFVSTFSASRGDTNSPLYPGKLSKEVDKAFIMIHKMIDGAINDNQSEIVNAIKSSGLSPKYAAKIIEKNDELEFINKDLLAKTVSDLGISEQKLMGVFSEQKRMSIIKSDFNL